MAGRDLYPVAMRALSVRPEVERPARLIAIAGVIGISIVLLVFSLRGIGLEDTAAYWGAAERLRGGLPLYPPLAHPELAQYVGATYTYSPWFAFAWVPLTFLPQPLATCLWMAVLMAAGAWLVLGLRDQPLAALFFGVLLFDTISEGNVQALMVAWLVWGIDRRSGPFWIALAASLKAFPLLLVLIYLRRRSWRRAAWTLGLTLFLVAPMLLFDLSHYPTSTGRHLLWGSPFYWPVAVAAVAYAGMWATRRYDRLAGAVAVIAVAPRFWLYDATMLLVGIAGRRNGPS